MFTWPTLGEGILAEGATRAKTERCEHTRLFCGPGIQNVKDKSWRLLYATIKTGLYWYMKGP